MSSAGVDLQAEEQRPEGPQSTKAGSTTLAHHDVGSPQLNCPEPEVKVGQIEVKENLLKWLLFLK